MTLEQLVLNYAIAGVAFAIARIPNYTRSVKAIATGVVPTKKGCGPKTQAELERHVSEVRKGLQNIEDLIGHKAAVAVICCVMTVSAIADIAIWPYRLLKSYKAFKARHQ